MVADVYDVGAFAGDRLLLTTDGLTGMIPDDYIADLLLAEREPDAAAAKLVEAANRAGGYDNITVIVVDIGETPARDVAPARGSVQARRRGAAPLLWIVAALALVLACGGGAWSYARSRAYLIDRSGDVTVYRGLPGSAPRAPARGHPVRQAPRRSRARERAPRRRTARNGHAGTEHHLHRDPGTVGWRAR
jgi:hypothetical protein